MRLRIGKGERRQERKTSPEDWNRENSQASQGLSCIRPTWLHRDRHPRRPIRSVEHRTACLSCPLAEATASYYYMHDRSRALFTHAHMRGISITARSCIKSSPQKLTSGYTNAAARHAAPGAGSWNVSRDSRQSLVDLYVCHVCLCFNASRLTRQRPGLAPNALTSSLADVPLPLCMYFIHPDRLAGPHPVPQSSHLLK